MSDTETSQDTEVLYNAECPVCSFEINHYAAYAAREGLPIRFDDLNAEERARWGIDREAAARRLHVRKDGQIYDGIPAFIILWQDMPRYRWLARVVCMPGVHWAACKLYDYVLAPLIYAWDVRRQRKRAAA
ncbi:MAG: DUF393 domain-containing protein [Pseudomonadota bacterium]